jgi:hypothetical protein
MRKLLLFVALIAAQLGQAQNCKISQYKGVYSALATGEFLPASGLPAFLLGPTVRVGRVVGDGNGNAQIRAITSLNGAVLGEEYGGTYLVNPDCTTEITLNVPFLGVTIPFHFKGVLSDNFKQHDLILLNPVGSTVMITLRAQNRASCSVGDLNGGWGVKMRGFVGLAPGVPGLPVARLGRIVFDGAGAFSAETTHIVDGVISPESFSGTYTVNPFCELKMSYNGNTWAGVLMDNSTGAHIMESVESPSELVPSFLGSAVAGTLTKQ